MSTLSLVAIVLAAVVIVAAFATRRREAVDPLARATGRERRKRRPLFKGLAATDIEKAALAIRQGRKEEALALLRATLDPADAQRIADTIEEQLASGGPLGRILALPHAHGPRSPRPGSK